MTVVSGPEIITTIAPELLSRWRSVPVAVAIDLASSVRQIDSGLRPLRPAGSQPRLFGQAVTVRCEPPDFGAVLHGVDLIKPGEVLVIAAARHADNAMIGEIVCGHLRSKGAAGIVCDGAIRDVAALSNWTDLPIYYRSINPRGPAGNARGAINQPVAVGATTVNPGDLLIGDDDGLVVLSGEELGRWIGAAEQRLASEGEWIQRLEAGESFGTLFGLEAAVAENADSPVTRTDRNHQNDQPESTDGVHVTGPKL